MRFILWLFSAAILIAAIVFALFNRQPVALDLWPFAMQLEMPLAVLACGFFLLGCFTGVLVSFLAGLKGRLANWRLRRTVSRLQKEVETTKGIIK